MALTTLGTPAKTIFLFHEMPKLAVEFVADVAIKEGQPVELTDDGTVTPWTNSHGLAVLIGYALFNAAAGERVTIKSRGYCLINALSSAACIPGPGVYQGMATGDNDMYSKYANPSLTGPSSPWIGTGDTNETVNSWILDEATGADEAIRVMLMD